MPILRSVRKMRHAISPRLAMRTRWNMALAVGGYPFQTRTRIGVGLYALQGLLSWGQFEMRTEHVHLGAHLDIAPRPRNPVFEGEPARGGHRHVHEEVDVARQIALAHAVPVARQRQQKAVAAVVHVTSCRARSEPGCSRPSRPRRCVSWRPQVSATMVSSVRPSLDKQLGAGGQVEAPLRRGWCRWRCSARRDRARCKRACRQPGCPRDRRCARSVRA